MKLRIPYTLPVVLAAVGLVLVVGCRREALEPTAEAAEAPQAVEAEDAAALTSRSEQLERQSAEIAAQQAALASRAEELAEEESRLAAEEEALAERARAVRRQEQQVDRRFEELEARIQELEATPAQVADPPAAALSAPAAPADPPVVVTRRPVESTAYRLTVPEGTSLAVELVDPLSSRDSRPGDTFRATVSRDVFVDGEVAIPAGSVVLGKVVDAVPGKRIGGQAKLVVSFTELEPLGGRSTAIEADFSLAGRKTTKRDAATIGGAAAAGAILGRVIDGDDDGGVLGAIIGAAAGTAVAAREREDVVLAPGTPFDLLLLRSIAIVRGES